jgi:hypothetical protein
VLYSNYGGTEVKYGAEEYLILSSRDVLAITRSEDTCGGDRYCPVLNHPTAW